MLLVGNKTSTLEFKSCVQNMISNNVTLPFNSIFLRFYSVIAPGDTVNVIGEFDDKGQCHVDHHHNFIIVHPDVLVAGTRVLLPACSNILDMYFVSIVALFSYNK